MKPLKEYTKGYRALCSDKEISGIFGNIEVTPLHSSSCSSFTPNDWKGAWSSPIAVCRPC